MPDDPGCDAARSAWNAMIDRRPAAIARCLGVADVVACANFARQHELVLSVKGGGHNIAGLAVCEGGLMLDMSLMRGVWVDQNGRCATSKAEPAPEIEMALRTALEGSPSSSGRPPDCLVLTIGGRQP